MRIIDPHFHLWDLDLWPNPNLGPDVERDLPVYHAGDYLRDMGRLPAPLELAASVHVETVVGQMEGGFRVDEVAETRFVCDQMEPTGHPFGIVAYIHLARGVRHTEQVLDRHLAAAGERLRGVRMILNHHPEDPALTWPQVERGDFLGDPAFRESLALLGERGLSFDLQCNPHQLADAAAAFAEHPETPVVVGHLASFYGGAEADAGYERTWREGLEAMAALPHASIKLSMVFFCAPGYHRDPSQEGRARNLVRQAIEIFGAGRCMFASNYPVDAVQGIDVPTLYGRFLDWTADLTPADRSSLFHDTAARVYRLEVSA